MSISVGNLNINNILLSNKKVKSVYIGNLKVWPELGDENIILNQFTIDQTSTSFNIVGT